MNMTTLWLFVACVIFLIIGIAGAIYYYRRVKAWDKCPTTEEYMECLFIGWCSWMTIALAGFGIFSMLFILIISILK